ncbi:MAG: ATP-binding protein [Nitrospirae bacterium]|nr:ATP-binding protein [Nitrospirota bacterium]
MINRGNPDKRAVSYLNTPRLIAFILIAAIVLSVVTAIWTKDRTIRKIHGEAIGRLNSYNSYLLDKVNTYIVFAKILSERPFTIGYLKHTAEQNTMNEYLFRFNESVGASVTYIMNKDGVTIASSNYKSSTSFVGQDFTFREYFQNAIKGIPDEYIAIGTVSKELGYYSSYPVRDGNEIIGVAVIKYDVNIFTPQNTEKEEILLVADSDGVIFHANDMRYLYHTVHKLSEDALQKIRHDNSYAGEPLLPLPIIKESEKDGIKFVTIRHSEQSQGYVDAEYLMVGTQDNATVWNVHLLVELSRVGFEVNKNVIYVLLSMVIFYLIGLFMVYKNKSRHALQESYNDLLKQKAIVDKHVREQETVNSVLKLSLSSDPIEVHMQRKLDVILEHFSQSKGCIFLYNEALKILQISAYRGFSEAHLALCSVVPVGKCLCGLAASTKELVFLSGRKDSNHTITYDGMPDHGHYCVPIVSTDKQTDRLLGVLNIYVAAGYERNVDDEVFIKNVAHIIAGIILRKQELKLIELDRTESLTTLAAGIAHEINNPLSFIKSSVSSFQKNLANIEHFIRHSLLTRDFLSSEQIESSSHQKNILDAISIMKFKINSSNKGIERIMEIVNGLRTFTRLNKTDIEEVDMNKCIDEALSMRININSMVTIVKEYAQLPLYLCESRSMNQCFYHIIDNAVQAVNDNGTIRIVTSATGVEGKLIQIRIEDNGVGMPEDAVKQAFVPFFTTKEVGSGKGLGLAMADGIIKRHGGKISIESTEGKGTAITILLPLMQNKR